MASTYVMNQVITADSFSATSPTTPVENLLNVFFWMQEVGILVISLSGHSLQIHVWTCNGGDYVTIQATATD